MQESTHDSWSVCSLRNIVHRIRNFKGSIADEVTLEVTPLVAHIAPDSVTFFNQLPANVGFIRHCILSLIFWTSEIKITMNSSHMYNLKKKNIECLHLQIRTFETRLVKMFVLSLTLYQNAKFMGKLMFINTWLNRYL